MNDFKGSIETNTLTGSLKYFKGEKGDSVFECWLQQDGNEGKTFEDFMNEVNIDLTGYATIKYVDEQINNAQLGGGDVNLDGYAKLTDIPTKTSQLANDNNFLTSVPSEYITETELNEKGYLTEHQDISNLALKTELHTHDNKSTLDSITNSKINQWNNKSNFSGSYNDLMDKPTIPKEYVLPEASSETLGGVKVGAGLSITNGVLSATGGGVADSVEWSNIQNKPNIPTKTSELTNDNGFLTSIPSEYVTETELNEKGYLTEHQDISKLALKTELHSHVNMAVLSTITNFKINQWNNKSDFSGSYNDLTNKPTIPTVDVTKAYVDGEVSKKADKSHTHNELHSHSNKTVLDGITSSKVNEWNNKSTFNGDYNSLTNKPVIPSTEGLATESYVQAKIAEASLSGGEVDLSGYATEEYVNIKVAENTDKITVLNDKVDNHIKNHPSSGTTIATKDIFANNDLPRVYMTSDRLGLLATKNDPEAICECEIKINNRTIRCYATGKVQGTSSASYPGKNFTFKFYSDAGCTSKEKIDVGWGEQYKYCFKKNWVDTTHTRNLAGARIAYDMVESRPNSDFKTNLQKAPRNGLVDGFPCKLYINGEFWGLYTWNIPKDAWQFGMDSDNPNHVVLCAEKNTDGDANTINSCQFKTLWTNGDGGDWSVEAGEYSNTVRDSLNRCIQFVMSSSDVEFYNNISDYFDLDSLLDYYCFSYFCVHLDGLAKNMLLATYDGRIWGASLYDMDSTFGAYWNGTSFVSPTYQCPGQYQEQFSLLWQRIEQCFGKELYARYMELRKGALSLGNIVTHVEEIYDLIPDRVLVDEKTKWTGLPSQNTNTITRFRNYMRDRAIYVDEKFQEFNLEKIPATGIALSQSALTFTDRNTQTLIANPSPSDTTDKVTWSVNPTGIVSIEDGVVTPITNGDCVITATCGAYSATCVVNVTLPTEQEPLNYVNFLLLAKNSPTTAFKLHAASTSTDCQGFECQPAFSGFDFPTDVNNTDLTYMSCDSFPVVTDSEKRVNNIPCISGANDGAKNYLTVKMLKSNASTVEEFKTYFDSNPTTIAIRIKENVKKYKLNINNAEILSTTHKANGYTCFEIIDNNIPTTNFGESNIFMSNLGYRSDWAQYTDWSYFKVSKWNGQFYIGFQIKNELLESTDAEGIRKYVAKDDYLYYID